jgi:hypothetical protein
MAQHACTECGAIRSSDQLVYCVHCDGHTCLGPDEITYVPYGDDIAADLVPTISECEGRHEASHEVVS